MARDTWVRNVTATAIRIATTMPAMARYSAVVWPRQDRRRDDRSRVRRAGDVHIRQPPTNGHILRPFQASVKPSLGNQARATLANNQAWALSWTMPCGRCPDVAWTSRGRCVDTMPRQRMIAPAPQALLSGAARVHVTQTIPILASDDHLVVVNKPSGIAVVPAAGAAPGESVRGWLERQLGRRALGGPPPRSNGLWRTGAGQIRRGSPGTQPGVRATTRPQDLPRLHGRRPLTASRPD